MENSSYATSYRSTAIIDVTGCDDTNTKLENSYYVAIKLESLTLRFK